MQIESQSTIRIVSQHLAFEGSGHFMNRCENLADDVRALAGLVSVRLDCRL
jgi:hypothetical protein